MKKIIINRLFQSFTELEHAIASARTTFQEKRGGSGALMERIGVYEEILEKQKSLATVMCGYATIGNWSEVARHIKLINGLSYMIRDDARQILEGAACRAQEDHHGVTYC